MKQFLILLSFIIVSCGNTLSQTSATKNEKTGTTDPALKQLIEEFFHKYQDDSPAGAIDFIFSTNPALTVAQFNEMKDKLNETYQLIGAFHGEELITTKQTSPSLVFFSYLVKHDKQPLRFSFIFYKPKEQWLLYKFKFDDEVDAELEESGRIYFIE